MKYTIPGAALNIANTWTAVQTFSAALVINAAIDHNPAALSGTPSTTGAWFDQAAQTFTDNATAASGTAAAMVFNAIQVPTLAASNTGVITTDAATWYIAGPPTAGTYQTIRRPWALWLDAGRLRVDDGVFIPNGSTTRSIAGFGSFFSITKEGSIAYLQSINAGTEFEALTIEASTVNFDLGAGSTERIFSATTSGIAFAAYNRTISASSAGVARSITYDITIGAGGAANGVLEHSFKLDTVIEAGLLGETDGSGSYTQLKTVWKIPYADAGAGTIGPTAPTTLATWNGGLFLGASNAVANGRLYWYANEALHYVDATAGFSYLYKEPTTFGNFNHDGPRPWQYGDVMVLKVDQYTKDGGHALPYPLEDALREKLLHLLNVDAEFRQQVKEKLYA